MGSPVVSGAAGGLSAAATSAAEVPRVAGCDRGVLTAGVLVFPAVPFVVGVAGVVVGVVGCACCVALSGVVDGGVQVVTDGTRRPWQSTRAPPCGDRR